MRALLDRCRFRGAAVGWDDIAGHEAAKRELRVVAAQVQRHSVAQRLGLTVVSGVLIVGPAGSGKTLLAKALAGAVERAVYVIPSAEVEAATIREVYQALAAEPCVVVWDEADVILRSRRVAERGAKAAAFCSALDGVNAIIGPITVCLTAEANGPSMRRPSAQAGSPHTSPWGSLIGRSVWLFGTGTRAGSRLPGRSTLSGPPTARSA